MSDLKPSLVWEGPSFPLQNDPQMSDLPMVSSFQTILRAQHGPPRKTRMFCIFLYNMLTYVACFLAFMFRVCDSLCFQWWTQVWTWHRVRPSHQRLPHGSPPARAVKVLGTAPVKSLGCREFLAVVVVVSEPSGHQSATGRMGKSNDWFYKRPRKHEGIKHATCAQSHPFQVGVLKWCAKPSTPEGGHCSCEEPRLQRILAVVVVVSEPSGISLLQGGWASQMIGFTRDRENMRGPSTPHVCSLIHFKLVF